MEGLIGGWEAEKTAFSWAVLGTEKRAVACFRFLTEPFAELAKILGRKDANSWKKLEQEVDEPHCRLQDTEQHN